MKLVVPELKILRENFILANIIPFIRFHSYSDSFIFFEKDIGQYLWFFFFYMKTFLSLDFVIPRKY